jgi:hypothetical protein
MKIFQGLTDVDQVLKVCSSQTICDYNMNRSG